MYTARSMSSSSRGMSVGSSSPFGEINGGVVAVVAIVALIITIVVFVLIVERKKAPRGKFTRWLREFLNFRSILISGIIKFVYLFLATLLTIMSFVVMFQGRDEMILPAIGIGLAMLVFGNVFLRILMEMSMIMIGLWENTNDMRAVIVKDEEKPEEKKPKGLKEPREPRESKPEVKPEEKKPEIIAESEVVEVVDVNK